MPGGGGGGTSQYSDYGPKPEGMQRLENGLYDIGNRALDLYNSPISQTGPTSPALGTNANWGWSNVGQSTGGNQSTAPGGGATPSTGTGTYGAGNGSSAGQRAAGFYDKNGNPLPAGSAGGGYSAWMYGDQGVTNQYGYTGKEYTDLVNGLDKGGASREHLNPNGTFGQSIWDGIGPDPRAGQAGNWQKRPGSPGDAQGGLPTQADYVWIPSKGGTGQQQQTAQDTGPRQPTLQDLLFQDALNKQLAGSERYDSLLADAGGLSSGAKNALTQSETAGDWYFGQAQDSYLQAKDYIGQAGTAGDKYYDAAWDSFGKSNGLIDQQVDALNYAKEGNVWYDNYTRDQLGQAASMTSSGEIPQAFKDALMGSMERALQDSMGQMITDMGGRGVINSSVANTGMANLGQQAANAYQDNYMNNFNSLLQGIQGNAAAATDAGGTFGQTNLGIAAGYGDAAGNSRLLGDSYVNAGSSRVNDLLNVGNSFNNNADSLMGAGSQRINDWLNINKGYNDTLNQNLLERQYLNQAPAQYWQNALGPFSIIPNLLGQQQQDFANTGRQTTVVG